MILFFCFSLFKKRSNPLENSDLVAAGLDKVFENLFLCHFNSLKCFFFTKLSCSGISECSDLVSFFFVKMSQENPYKLVNSLHAHDGPIRSITIGPSGEIVTGCQSDAPNLRRWAWNGESIEEIGTCVYHDHWVTALTALQPDPSRSFYPEVLFSKPMFHKLISMLAKYSSPFNAFCVFIESFCNIGCGFLYMAATNPLFFLK